MSSPHKIPENVLKLIIKEMVKEGFTPDGMETIYESHSDLDKIDFILKKFGIPRKKIEDYGFYAMLLLENYDEKNQTIKSPLIIPKKLKVEAYFDVDLRKQITEKWIVKLDTYNPDKTFITDMMSAGDITYHDGEFYDDDVEDVDMNDWWLTKVEIIKDLDESINKKNVLTEGRLYFRRFEKELPQNVLKLILKRLILNFKDAGIIHEKEPYSNSNILEKIDDTLKIFGILNLDWEEYGFFWKLYLENKNYEDGDDIEIPTLKSFEVTIDESVTKYASDIWEHDIYSYDEDFVRAQINYNDDFDLYNGHFVRDEVHDADTRGQDIIDVVENKTDKNLTESQKTKKLIKENNKSELIRLQKLKEQIEKRIKEITS